MSTEFLFGIMKRFCRLSMVTEDTKNSCGDPEVHIKTVKVTPFYYSYYVTPDQDMEAQGQAWESIGPDCLLC